MVTVPLLRVTPPLTLFLVTLFSYPVNKARKGQRKKEMVTGSSDFTLLICNFVLALAIDLSRKMFYLN